jgi:DNA-directed RNA polymerase specialized sigma24 family protein
MRTDIETENGRVMTCAEPAIAAQDVQDALAGLAPQQLQVIISIHYYGRTVAETSQFLGITTDAVRWLAYYSLRELHQVLSACGAGP